MTRPYRTGFWTEATLARAKRLYEGGMTATEVAASLGTTRNAVCGKVDRLGWVRPPVVPKRAKHQGSWTDERAETVKALWADGKSSGEIARAVTVPGWRPTRETICGKLWRMGLCGTREPRAPKVKQTRVQASGTATGLVQRAQRARVTVSALTGLPSGPRSGPTLPPASAGPLLCEPVTVLDLASTSCRYPVSGEGEATLFCGFPTATTYCTRHAAVCFNPVQPQRIRA